METARGSSATERHVSAAVPVNSASAIPQYLPIARVHARTRSEVSGAKWLN